MKMIQEKRFSYGKSEIVVCNDEYDLGQVAAAAVANTMRRLLAEQDNIRVTVAAGESQNTFFDALAQEKAVDWQRVVCFSVDDFYHLGIPEQFTCGHQMEKQLWSNVKPGQTHRVRADADDPQAEAIRFEYVLRQAGPMDVLCQRIGTSGHLALNEPFDINFDDSAWVRVVTVSPQSKRQLIKDPNFKALGFIPDQGITMTIPAILSSRHLFTIVPLALKRPILTRLFATPAPTTALPASILSRTTGTIFVDRNSCPDEGSRAVPPNPTSPAG
jgi:glucosamine-6-phosphate deaminase